MTSIFEHIDREGDRLTVRKSDHVVPGAVIVEAYDNSDGDLGNVRLAPAQITELRSALEPLDPTAKKAEATPVIVSGLEYRLLPGARIEADPTAPHSEAVHDRVTRVRVESVHGDDTCSVTGLDGRNAHDPGRYIVARSFLAPLPAKPEVEADKEYRLLPSATYCGGTRSDMPKEGTTRVRVLRAKPDIDGDVFVEPLDGRTAGKPGNGRYVHPEHLAPIPDLKVGDVVAILPNAKTALGGGVYFAADVTRVKVETNPEPGGDYRVSNVDGSGLDLGHGKATGRLGEKQYVGRAYLGDPEPAPRMGATPTFSIVDETHAFAASDAAEPEELDDLRVRAVEKALELLGASDFDDVSASEIIAVAAYIAGEIDADEADA